MGFLRKLTIISTGGLAPIKAESFKERTAKAAERQLRLQRQALVSSHAAPSGAEPSTTADTVSAALSRASNVGEEVFPRCSVGGLRSALLDVIGELGYAAHDVTFDDGAVVFFRKGWTIWSWSREMAVVVTPYDGGARAMVAAMPNAASYDWGESRKIARSVLTGIAEAAIMALDGSPSADSQADAAPAGRSTAEEIERLARLHAQGALSDEEFAAAKRKALAA